MQKEKTIASSMKITKCWYFACIMVHEVSGRRCVKFICSLSFAREAKTFFTETYYQKKRKMGYLHGREYRSKLWRLLIVHASYIRL
jgi:hypothetical protein